MPVNHLSGSPPKHFVVIVPGYMGSLLRDKQSGKIVWLDLPRLLFDQLAGQDAVGEMLQKMDFSNQDLEPAGILKDVLIAPPLFKQEQYGRLAAKLENWGYQIDPTNPKSEDLCAYTFSYDWRQDNRDSARALGKAIDQWAQHHPGAKAWLIAHSNGGIISRWYIQREGGAARVGKLLLMGSPWDGAPKSLRILSEGMTILGLKKFNLWHLASRINDLIRTFPSFYQLLPVANPFLRDENNQDIDLFADDRWLSTAEERQLLAQAKQFNIDLAQPSGVYTVCYYGTRKPTTSAAIARKNAAGQFDDIQWQETEAGDGTVPVRSALHPWVTAGNGLPFPVTHGDIYVNETVLEFLWKELIGQYTGQTRAAIYLPDFAIVFEQDQDFYAPGEPVKAWAQLSDPSTGKGISDAGVKMQLIFRESLPGQIVTTRPAPTDAYRLEETSIAGRFEGSLPAPTVEGYYTLRATVKLVRMPRVALDELVVIEAD